MVLSEKSHCTNWCCSIAIAAPNAVRADFVPTKEKDSLEKLQSGDSSVTYGFVLFAMCNHWEVVTPVMAGWWRVVRWLVG
jgi:hypothetical protein